MVEYSFSAKDLVRRIIRTQMVCLLLIFLPILIFFKSSLVLPIFYGAAIAALGFVILVTVVVNATKGTRRAALMVTIGMVKIAALGMVIWLLFSKVHIEPLAFLAGFSTMAVALLFENIRVVSSTRL